MSHGTEVAALTDFRAIATCATATYSRHPMPASPLRAIASLSLAILLFADAPAHAERPDLDAFSPAFLGMYRKLMEIDGEIQRHAKRYGVDLDLARAVCLYESGANAGLASQVGAQGFYQVMPNTFRELDVASNIEAGIKYLSQLIRQFGREDRAVAAYNGGPGRVGRTGSLPLETVQYVIGVGYYRTVLKQHQDTIKEYASRLRLIAVSPEDDWSSIARRINVPEWQLRLHNPFLAGRALRTGQQLAYPQQPRAGLLVPVDGGALYRMRHGDNYVKLAIMLGLELDGFRSANGLWQVQSVPVGVDLRIPFLIDKANVVKAALMGVLDQTSTGNQSSQRTVVVHRVATGENLSALARRYGTTVSAIQKANRLAKTTIRAGQVLRIP